VASWDALERAVRSKRRGAFGLIVMRRPHGVGHAFALYYTKDGGLAYVDFVSRPPGRATARLIEAERRPRSAAEYKGRLGDLLASAVSTQAMVFGVGGQAEVDALKSFPESAFIPRVVTDKSPYLGVGRGGGEIEGVAQVLPPPRVATPYNFWLVKGRYVTLVADGMFRDLLEVVTPPMVMLPGEVGPTLAEVAAEVRDVYRRLFGGSGHTLAGTLYR
jgi:hypothetical protein